VVSFRIAAMVAKTAVVDQVHLTEDAGMGNAAFEGCVLSVMSSLHSTRRKEGTLSVTYPLMFSSDAALSTAALTPFRVPGPRTLTLGRLATCPCRRPAVVRHAAAALALLLHLLGDMASV